MNQTEQMLRDALQALLAAVQRCHCEKSGAAQDLAHTALAAEPAKQEPCPSCRNADIYACTCPFKTERNSQPECFEPAKLVRLTQIERDRIAVSCQSTQQVINAVENALEAKNGGGTE